MGGRPRGWRSRHPACPIRIISVHLRVAALRAQGRGPDPGLQSAAGAWAPGQGAGALSRQYLSRLALPAGMPSDPVISYPEREWLGINLAIAAAHGWLRHQHGHGSCILRRPSQLWPAHRGVGGSVANADSYL
jgi:hypothetical protein